MLLVRTGLEFFVMLEHLSMPRHLFRSTQISVRGGHRRGPPGGGGENHQGQAAGLPAQGPPLLLTPGDRGLGGGCAKELSLSLKDQKNML